MRVCVVYVAKEVASFQGARSINGFGSMLELQISRRLQRIPITIVYSRETVINMMQESLTSKYNKLLNFRHEEVII